MSLVSPKSPKSILLRLRELSLLVLTRNVGIPLSLCRGLVFFYVVIVILYVVVVMGGWYFMCGVFCAVGMVVVRGGCEW